MQCETADVANEVALEGENGDVHCRKDSSNIARKRHCCICKERRTGEKGRLCIGEERNGLARLKLQIIAFANRKESERSDLYASARRAAILHIIAFASRKSRKEETMQRCKKRRKVADAG